MPQPFLPKFSRKRYVVGPEALKDRPKLASATGRCISTWSWVDNEIGGLFGILLGTDSPSAYAAFLILRRWSNQRDVLDAVANEKLAGDEIAVYQALITEYGGLEAERNRLAHSCFGNCPDDDNLLFTVDVKHHVRWQAEILPKHAKGIIPSDPHAGLKEKMYVYRLSELETLHGHMEQLWWDVFYFNGYLRASGNSGRIAEFQKVLKSDHIQQHIRSIKSGSSPPR
jgi:hypothetical protein